MVNLKSKFLQVHSMSKNHSSSSSCRWMIQAKENSIADSKIVVNTASVMSNSTKIRAGCIFPFTLKVGIPQIEAEAWQEGVT